MAKHEITTEAKTVAAAIEQGLRELGMRRDQVEVTVVQEPSNGILGFGVKTAKVVLREKLWAPEGRTAEIDYDVEQPKTNESARPMERDSAPRPRREPRRQESQGSGRGGERRRDGGGGGGRGGRPQRESRDRHERRPAVEFPPAPAGPWTPNVPKTTNASSDEAKAVLTELLGMLELGDATVLAGWDESQGRVRAEIVSPNAKQLIGRDGAVLESLQFLTTLITNRRLKAQVAVQVDVEGHWQRIEERAVASAHKGVEEVKRSGRPFRLEAMEAPLRRLIHKTLAESPVVETVSEGEGAYRKVVLKPRRK